MSSACRRRGDVSRVMAGVVGGLLGALAMNLFARAANGAGNGREAGGATPGGDRIGRGMQPPQARGSADEDAAVQVGTAAYQAVTGREPTRTEKHWLGTAAHYGLSAALGAAYAAMADRAPAIRACYGTLYGTAVWVLADEIAVPALGLSRGPRELPASVHLYSLCGHWIFGAAVEGTLRVSD